MFPVSQHWVCSIRFLLSLFDFLLYWTKVSLKYLVIPDCLWDTKILTGNSMDTWSYSLSTSWFHCRVIKQRTGYFIQRLPNISISKLLPFGKIVAQNMSLISHFGNKQDCQCFEKMTTGRDLEISILDLISFYLLYCFLYSHLY